MPSERHPGPPPSPDEVEAVFGPAPAGADPLIGELAAAALLAARRAAGILLAGSRHGRSEQDGASPAAGPGGFDHDVTTKSSATDMVSEVDRNAEAAVDAVLGGLRPDDGLLAEEGTARAGTTGIRWVVDPLDGTTNFLFGVPQWSVSIAAERDGEALVGIVVDPGRSETWAATADRAAHLDGRPCRVAEGRSSIETALVSTGFGYVADRRAWQARVLATVAPAVRDLRRFGSAALDLCWVGGGRVDAYYEWGLNPWDLAAGRLICNRAGGRAEALDGRLVVATSRALWGPLTELLGRAGALEPPEGDEPRHW